MRAPLPSKRPALQSCRPDRALSRRGERGRGSEGWQTNPAFSGAGEIRVDDPLGPLPGDEAALAQAASPDDPEAFWEAEYRRQLVGRALSVMQAEFEPTTWKACWEFVVVGRPAREVAAGLDISENAVYIAKSRVLRRLRRELDGLLE